MFKSKILFRKLEQEDRIVLEILIFKPAAGV